MEQKLGKDLASMRGLGASLLVAFVLLLSAIMELPVAGALTEAQILLRMKASLRDPQRSVSNWDNSSATPCSWAGVQCDGSNVTGLEFPNFGLSGPLPTLFCKLPHLLRVNFYYNDFGGTFPTELLSCTRITYLNISQNLLVGALPEGIDQMQALQILDLSGNNFSGLIPDGFGRLLELLELDLNNNLLNTTIHASLGQLGKLQKLSLAYNPFAPGVLPPELGNMTELTFLWLAGCNLIGSIPDSLGNLTKLNNLDLSINSLKGHIPPAIMNLPLLYQLELYHNQLQGSIPDNIGNLVSLVNIDMSMNQLTGRIPDSISQMRRLASFHLYENSLWGEIPAALADLPHLQDLRIFNNSLNGTLPINLGKSSKLVTVDVSYNQLSGPLPPDLCAGGTLQTLVTMQNRFTGSIPPPYGNCPTLQRIRLSNNQLSGKVPESFWGIHSLSLLDLASNKFEGDISSSIVNAFNLSTIYLQDNQFSGSLPLGIGKLSNLSVIRVQHNRLSGLIPIEIGHLSHLYNLHLEYNSFSGGIPDEIALCRQLTFLDLSNNQLTGAIPPSLGELPSLNSLDLSNNMLSGEIPQSLSSLNLNNFNVSNNRLSGPIPSGLMNGAYYTSFLGNQDLCGDGLLDVTPCQHVRKNSKLLQVVLAGTFAAALLVLLVGLAGFYKRYWHYRHFAKGGLKSDKSSWSLTSFHKLGFNEYEILNSLDEDNVIGSGGAGKVYKATLSNGETVAVKKLWVNGKGEAKHDNGFKAEVETLGKIRHRNIVKLLCCCSDNATNLLVYEYMANGSLGNLLHGNKASILDWLSRYKIAVGAAQGLSYLHHDCTPAIVHRDVKSNNILLDSDFEAHVSDFGLAKILENVKGDSSTVAGSYGYIAPEHAYTPKVTEKSDIYSFGVVLLELVTGKRPIVPEFGDNCDIVKWVCGKLQMPDGGVMDVLDKSLSHSSKEDMLPVLKIALLCTSALPVHRPSMREVVEMLLEADPQLKCKSGKGSKRSRSWKEPSFSKLTV